MSPYTISLCAVQLAVVGFHDVDKDILSIRRVKESVQFELNILRRTRHLPLT
jgi:hypothetical protein